MQNVECKIRRFMLWIAPVGIVADRLIKWYAQHLPNGTVFSFGPGLNFGYYPNPALFFFPPWRFIPYLALAVFITLTVLLIIRVRNDRLRPENWSLIPILLGGASNVFDRFAFGGVIDYVEILTLATFNLADILILVGLIFTFIKPYDQRC